MSECQVAPFGFTVEKFEVLKDIHKEYFPEGINNLSGSIYPEIPCCYFISTVTNSSEWQYGYSDNDKCYSQIRFEQLSEDQYKIHSMRGSAARVRFEENEPHEPWEYFKVMELDIPDTVGTFDEILDAYRKYEQSRLEVVKKYGHLMG